MNSASLRIRIARRLIAHASNMLPRQRHDWANALRAEFEHVDDHSALQWACGCVFASYAERLRAMNRSSLIIPKWLLAVETSVCFFPASLLWLIAVLNINKFTNEPAIIISTFLMTIAPINEVLAMRFIATGHPLHYKFHLVSALLFALYAIPQIMGIRFTGHGPSFAWFQFDWGLVALFSILPALCCWHLSLFAKTRTDPPLAA